MIEYAQFTLKNGLQLIVHEDHSTPMVAVNVLYKVGSKNEEEDKTGFAHLFEHLMFSGSKHVEDFDIPIQMAGGENNAFTNSDMTNFYNILPKENLETALWLESDRMAHLDINEKSLDIQKKVVVEEFKEVCLNQPYGDMWHHMSEEAYKKHAYKWPTIGKDFSHIENASLQDVQNFFELYYCPNNAIITIAGDVKSKDVLDLVEKYFGWIANTSTPDQYIYPELEPEQKQKNQKILKKNYPATSFYMGFHMKDRLHRDYYVADLISDVLANGRSSRFYQNLYKQTTLFTTIDSYIGGTTDPGLFIIEGKLNPKIDIEEAKKLIWKELEILKSEMISEEVVEKLLNKIESAHVYGEVNILNKSLNLAFYTYLGDTSLINNQMKVYKSISKEDIHRVANEMFKEENCTEIIYLD